LIRRHELALDVAHDEAVLVLARGEGVEVPRVGYPPRLDHLPGGEVRAADVADLALAGEVVEGAQRLLDRRQRVGAVELVEVEPVGLEPPQAVLDRLHDVGARAALHAAGIVHVHAELRRQHDVLAALAEDFAEETLRAAALAVDVGGVEERDAEIERLVDDLAGRLKVDPAAEIVAAETDERHPKAR